jgi:tRNA-dihydrouridine synthase
MVAMAARVVQSVSLPVTVKTRVGWGPESHMPIVDLAPRLEDAGVAALTVHCRTADMGHRGAADWSWAARARERVKIPVVVNGDIRGAAEAEKALGETGCAGVMVGRRAIDHPWVFREIRAWLDRGVVVGPPTPSERLGMCKAHLEANVGARGEHFGVRVTRRHLAGYLKGLPGAAALRQRLLVEDSLSRCLDILAAAEESLRGWVPRGDGGDPSTPIDSSMVTSEPLDSSSAC